MDAGKSLCAYLEVMFPDVWHGQNSGFKISMKHHVYNDIMSLADLHDEAAIRKRLADNEAHRKEWVGAYRKMRRAKREKPTQPHEAEFMAELFALQMPAVKAIAARNVALANADAEYLSWQSQPQPGSSVK